MRSHTINYVFTKFAVCFSVPTHNDLFCLELSSKVSIVLWDFRLFLLARI